MSSGRSVYGYATPPVGAKPILTGRTAYLRQVDDRLPVRHQKMMRHQKRLRHGKFHARSMDTAQMSEADHALRLVDRNKIFADITEILGNHLRIFSEPLYYVRDSASRPAHKAPAGIPSETVSDTV